MYGCSYRVSDLLSSQGCYFRTLASYSSPAAQLQINLGEAHVIRNAGGCAYVGTFRQIVSYSSTVNFVCSKEALRSIVISQRLLGTTEIAVFHHTDCGMLTFTNDDIRHKVKTEEPGNAVVAEAVDKIDFLPFPHLEESVKDDVEYLKGSKLLKKGTHLSGWIYDVTQGKVCLRFFFLCMKRKSLN